jgi:flagellar biosynthesis chaperone FliJ
MNNKKEENVMNEKDMSTIVETIRTTMLETVNVRETYEQQITELNSKIAEKDNEISELSARIEALTVEKNEAIVAKETAESATENATKELNEVKCAKAVGELNEKLSMFSKEQIAYANSEIEAFKQNPLTSEVNCVISKIYEGIGKAKVESEQVSNELNSDNSFDIFSPMLTEDSEDDSYADLF